MDAFPIVPDELGLPLGMTYTADGEILSFGEIECDRVRQSVKRTLSAADYHRGEMLYGRALGRVVAHEMYHMLARNKCHAAEGVAKERFSGYDLDREHLPLAEASRKAIRSQVPAQ